MHTDSHRLKEKTLFWVESDRAGASQFQGREAGADFALSSVCSAETSCTELRE